MKSCTKNEVLAGICAVDDDSRFCASVAESTAGHFAKRLRTDGVCYKRPAKMLATDSTFANCVLARVTRGFEVEQLR